jgi:hypothetical protein
VLTAGSHDLGALRLAFPDFALFALTQNVRWRWGRAVAGNGISGHGPMPQNPPISTRQLMAFRARSISVTNSAPWFGTL